jgi:hypothetical protein
VHHDALRSRQVGPLSDRFDAAVYSIVDALHPYSVIGWHCTRFTDHEVDEIKSHGVALLDVELVALAERSDDSADTGGGEKKDYRVGGPSDV